MYIYIYMCIYTCIHIYIHIREYIQYIHIYIHIYEAIHFVAIFVTIFIFPSDLFSTICLFSHCCIVFHITDLIVFNRGECTQIIERGVP